MSVLSPRAHGYLDYLTVVLFALAPTVLGLTGLPAQIAYALAAIHLLLTLVTHFPLGVAKIVPLPAHGAIELVVSVALVALPWLAGFAADATARWFYVVLGIVIFVVWLLTRYEL